MVKILKRNKHAGKRGQALALMVIALPAFVGALGLALDVANFYFNYYKLQQAADASVLAGAECLPSGNSCNGTCGTGSTSSCAPTATASYYATSLNDVRGTDTVTGPSTLAANTQMTITIARNVPYYFARIVGADHGTISVSATAQGGPPSGININDLLPVGLQVCGDPSHPVATCTTAYSLGDTLTFNEKGTAPGNWDPVDFGSLTVVSVCPTGSGCIDSNTGCAAAKSVRDLAKSLIVKGNSIDPGGTALSHTPDDPRAVAVPMVDWTGITGTKPLNVYGFAEIWLVSTDSSRGCSTNPSITATFITQTVNGVIDTGGTAFNVGPPLAIKLIK